MAIDRESDSNPVIPNDTVGYSELSDIREHSATSEVGMP